jgi:hypothetical protein
MSSDRPNPTLEDPSTRSVTGRAKQTARPAPVRLLGQRHRSAGKTVWIGQW